MLLLRTYQDALTKHLSTYYLINKFTLNFMDSHLKFGSILWPDKDQLPRPQSVFCATVLENEAVKPWRLARHLNTKHSDAVKNLLNPSCLKRFTKIGK
jgi:hypothetical protein